MLVHEEGYDETIISNENIVAEDNELVDKILQQDKTLADNSIDLEYDEKTIDKVDKIIEKSLQNNGNMDATVNSDKLLPETVPFNNLHNTNTEGVKKDNSYTDHIAGDHIENLDENRIETINDTIEEELGQDDQDEDSSELIIVINGQNSHPDNQDESKVKGKTRLEELKDIMEDWIDYNYNEHESEEESGFA